MTVWTDAPNAERARRVMDLMGSSVRPLAVGGPRCTEVERLGRHLDCWVGHDLRQILVDRPARFLLLATAREVRQEDVRLAIQNGTQVLSLEPLITELAQLRRVLTEADLARLHDLPAFDASAGSRAAAELPDDTDAPRLTRMISHGRRDEGSLLSRVIDGWIALLRHVPLPETLLAQHFPAAGHPAADPPAATLEPGWISAFGPTVDGGSVYLEVCDTAPQHHRTLQITTPHQQLRIGDADHHRRGDSQDQTQPRPVALPPDRLDPPTYPDLVADHWRRLLADRPTLVPLHRRAQALACLAASRLSIRTRQPENPQRLLELGGY